MNPVPEIVPKSVDLIADRIARNAHHTQKRNNDEPYILHVERVAGRVAPNLKALAMLHDVIEDNVSYPESRLRQDLPDWLVDRVVILTRRPDEPYDDYIVRVAQDDATRTVKIADLSDNIQDLKPGSLRDKYRLAARLLAAKTKFVIQQHFIGRWDDVKTVPNEEIGKNWLHDENVKLPRPHRLIKRTEQVIQLCPK